MFADNQVPGRTVGQWVSCAMLDPMQNWIAFNGNGCRRGLGYGIVGRKGTGWLAKCGYWPPKRGVSRGKTVRQFLKDLGIVAEKLGLVVVGFAAKRGEWLTLEDLRRMARNQTSFQRLEAVTLRVYGPPDYHDRLRDHFERQGRITIPKTVLGTDGQVSAPEVVLPRLMSKRGVTQKQLAQHLGCSQAFVSNLLSLTVSHSENNVSPIITYTNVNT